MARDHSRSGEPSDPAAAPEIAALAEALRATRADARALVTGLTDAHGMGRAAPGSWSVSECLDHLATADRIYLEAMRPPADAARTQGRLRRRPALPGLIGGLFVRSMEPPVKPAFRIKAPRPIRPRTAPDLQDAIQAFFSAHDDAERFLHACADLDLAGIRFPNPFIRGVRFSLATGLHVIAAHERRHLWQAWNVRRATESA